MTVSHAKKTGARGYRDLGRRVGTYSNGEGHKPKPELPPVVVKVATRHIADIDKDIAWDWILGETE